MLITGQPDKMLTDLRNSKGNTELSARATWIVVCGENHNISKLVFSLCMSECLPKARNAARTFLHCSPCSHFLLGQP